MELRFRIPMVSVIAVSLSCNFGFQNPGSQFPPDKISGFQKQKFRGFRNPDPGFPYLGQSSVHYWGARSLTISHVVRNTGIYIGLALFVDLSMPWKKFLLHDRRCKWSCLRKQWVSVFFFSVFYLMELFPSGCWQTIRIPYYFICLWIFNNDL